MKLGLISDTHDDYEAIDAAFAIFERQQVDLIIHCGDWVHAPTLRYFGQKAREAQIPVKCVVGNNEKPEDLENFRQILDSDEYPLEMSEDMYDLTFEVDGKDYAICHGHDEILLDSLAQSGDYTMIFRGHTHAPKDYEISRTRVVNPGAVCRYTLGAETHERGLAILDTETSKVDFILL